MRLYLWRQRTEIYALEIDVMNRDNYEAAVQFYTAYKEGENGQVTLYQAYKNGIFGVLTFICREGRVQSYYIGIHWNKEGIPEIYQTGSGNIVDLNLTKKGYFIYMREFTAMHGSLREYIRLKPLPKQCRELTEKYISGLSYVDYDLLLNEWKEEQAGRLFEYTGFYGHLSDADGRNAGITGWKNSCIVFE